MSILEIFSIIIVGVCVVLCAICIIVLNQVTTTRNHLQQIEKKIDAIYTQIRIKDYINPSTYPFTTKKY